MSDMIGRMFGMFQITDELGHGGMANVYLATQSSVRRQVAIKVLPAMFLQDRNFIARFQREVQLIAKLQHPRILPIYDFGEQDGVPYIVMAYMTGGTLSDLIHNSRGGMGFDEVARLVTQAAEGLDYAHEQGIIHRDFKPSNVLLDAKGNVHLADFGIAKATADTAQITGSGFVGTPAYAAPEMSTPDGLSPKVDVYALGVTLYQMLTGKLPYDAPTPMGVLMAHMAHPIPNLRATRRDATDSMQSVLDQAMAKNPDQRYASAGELATDLRAALSGATIQPRYAADTVAMRTEQDQYNPNALTEPDQPASTAFNTSPMTMPAVPVIQSTQQPASATQAVAPTKSAWPILVPILIGAAGLALAGFIALYALSNLFNGDETASTDGESSETVVEDGGEATPFVASSGGSDLEFPLSESATFTGLEGQVYSFGLSDDGSQMIVGEITKVSVWDVALGTVLFEPPTDGAEGNINAVAFSPDGKYLMATIGQCINSYEAANGEYVGDYCEIGPLMYALDFSSDGSLMAAGSGGSVIGMYEVESRDMLWEGEQHEGDIHAVAFTSDDASVLSASADAQIISWDVETGDSDWAIDMDARDIWDMDLSPNGNQAIASASNNDLLIFNPTTGEEVRYLSNDGAISYTVAYSPNGALIAVGTEGGNILIYDAASGEKLSKWFAHSGIITQLTWLNDSVLVSSSVDGTIKFWE